MQEKRNILIELTKTEYSDIINALSQASANVAYYPLNNLFTQAHPQIKANEEQAAREAALEAEAAKSARKSPKKATAGRKENIKRRKTA